MCVQTETKAIFCLTSFAHISHSPETPVLSVISLQSLYVYESANSRLYIGFVCNHTASKIPFTFCLNTLKVQSTILIQNTFCQIQRISPHGPLAFHSVCVEKTVFIHSPGSVNGKQTERLR